MHLLVEALVRRANLRQDLGFLVLPGPLSKVKEGARRGRSRRRPAPRPPATGSTQDFLGQGLPRIEVVLRDNEPTRQGRKDGGGGRGCSSFARHFAVSTIDQASLRALWEGGEAFSLCAGLRPYHIDNAAPKVRCIVSRRSDRSDR